MQTIDLIKRQYGVNCFDVDDELGVTSIATSATRFLANNPNCIQLTIINTGSSDMFIFTDSNVSLTRGILIAANGGSYEIDFTRFGTLPTREWWGIGSGGSTTVTTKRLLAST